MRRIRILILEDDLETLAKLLDALHKLEETMVNAPNSADIAVTVLSEFTQVEEYINTILKPTFDIVLLDRDCKAGGSFHTLDSDKVGVDKIVSISSVPQYNELMANLGVTKVVQKDYEELDSFVRQVITYIKSMI